MVKAAFLATSIALVGCKRPAADLPDAQVAPGPALSRTAPSASAAPPPAVENPEALVQRWNVAHATRDASMLADLYADKVWHYQNEMSRADCVKTKAAAFAATPDFTQSIGEITLETGLNDPKETWARFTKTVTANGTKKDYLALLILSDSRITQERDDTSWCTDSANFPSRRVVPPFTMSGADAMGAANTSQYAKRLRARHRSANVDEKGFGCARRCSPPSRECGYRMRFSDYADTTHESNLLAWVTVDPMTRLLWWKDDRADAADQWRSERLPDAGEPMLR